MSRLPAYSSGVSAAHSATLQSTRGQKLLTQTRRRLSGLTSPSNAFLCAVVILLYLVVLSYSAHRWFDHDEFEHIHSTWYVVNGYVPYSDFFQVHHPLFWWSIAPLLLVLGYSTQTVLVLRLVMLGLTAGIACTTYAIARRVTLSARAGLLSIVLLLSMVLFLEKSVEIRPDVPQVLLGLISVFFLVSFIRTREDRHVLLAGISASLSFLFLQKSLFLLAAFAAVLSYELLRRRVSLKSILYFAVAFSLPVVLFLAYLLLSGAFQDYVLTNWLLHTEQLMSFSPLKYPYRSFTTQNALFWLLAPTSVGFVLLGRKNDRTLKATALLGVALLLSVLLLKRPHRQSFLFAMPLLCIPIGHSLDRAIARFRLHGIYIGLLVILVVIQPLTFLAPRCTSSEPKDEQLAKVDFVVDNSTDSDLVYDGDIQFNLYRDDLHYFWFSVGENKGLDTYNTITDNRYGDYDICQLVRTKQPKFISSYGLRLDTCGLRPFYDGTTFPGLYVRSEGQVGQHMLRRNAGDALALIGYHVEEIGGQDGDRLYVTLWWQSLAEMDRDYTVFIHVVTSGNDIWAQHDSLLLSGQRPTSAWRQGEIVEQQYDVPLPAAALPGEFTIRTGLYFWATGERLPIRDESGQRVPDDSILLLPEMNEQEGQ